MSQETESRSSTDLTPEELRAAEKVALSFVSAYKYYSLYPEGHAFSQSYLIRLEDDLLDFFRSYKTLKFNVEKYCFYYKGVPVVNGSADEGNPAYLLTRDRITYLEFDKNIRRSELTALFDILNLHRNPLEEVDGDIATTLWHIPLNSIHYEAADIFAMEAIDFELSMFKPLPEDAFSTQNDSSLLTGEGNQNASRQKGITSGSHAGTDQHYAGFYGNETGVGMDSLDGPDSSAPSLLLVAREKDLSELTKHEHMVLEAQVQQEEERDIAGDTIDILLILLSLESNQIEFATILDFLEFEYFEALAKNEFHLANRICKNVSNIANAISSKKPWAGTLINLFFAAIAKEERYQQLPIMTDGNYFTPDSEQFKYLLSAFTMLPGEIIFTLTALAKRTSPDNLRQRNELLESIEKKSQRNPDCFLQLLKEVDEEMGHYLFPVIETLERKETCRINLAMTKSPFNSIRRIALDSLFMTNCVLEPNDLIHLLGDDDEHIREKVLSFFDTRDIGTTEQTIIQFLQSEAAQHIGQIHILQCYRIISRPLSDNAMEFLHGVLLGSKITSVFSKISMTHKKGAAYALMRSGRDDAREIVIKGAESVRPDVRHACQKILEHI